MQTTKTLGDWIRDLPRPAVACTIVRIVGSAPQEVGAKMWVTADRFHGTLGGGEFERRILGDARELLRAADAPARVREYVLCKEMGQCCGGRAEVFFEPVARRRTVHLFGGGHVGRATAQVLSQMSLEIHLIDPRPEWAAPDGLPADVQALQMDPLAYARSRAWTQSDAVCIFTHSHDLDYVLVRHFLNQPAGYLGLIGSEHKADVFRARLKSESGGDAGDERLEELWERKVHCPIGVPLEGKNPKVIAVSIAAELLKEWAL